jgi:hypothetical protein
MICKGVKWSVLILGVLAAAASAADNRKEFRYTVGPGASISVANESGPVQVKGSAGRQVVVVTTTHSDQVEIDCTQNGNRVQAITHFLQGRTDGPDGQVEYQLLVPADASVTVRAPSGPITAEKMRGDLSLEGDAAKIDVHDTSNAHVHVRTISGPVRLVNILNGHVEITSLSGDVQLDSVSGPYVSVNTAKGSIRYSGDFGGGGDYMLVNHSGNIDVLRALSPAAWRTIFRCNRNSTPISPSLRDVPSQAPRTPGAPRYNSAPSVVKSA